MKLTEQQIKEINENCPYDQGIFVQPNGIPTHVKEPVIYSRYISGGKPGSCWDDEDTVNEKYECDVPSDHFKVLDDILAILKPNISYLDYKRLLPLKHHEVETEYGYYGDFSEYTTEYIILSDFYKEFALLD